jgi:hypothetical protein
MVVAIKSVKNVTVLFWLDVTKERRIFALYMGD